MTAPILSATPFGRQTALALGGLLIAAQVSAPRYTAGMLGCVAYLERTQSDIRSQIGNTVRVESAERAGVLVLHAIAGSPGLAVEAWYDSLSLWREGPEGRITPDAEGLLGGRWRGTLSADGIYRRDAVPFIPDEVAEIADLRGALDDFLPRLPEKALREGEPHAWTRRSRSDTTAVVQDSLTASVHREVEEKGSLIWDGRLGPTQWERTLVLTALVEPRGPIRRAIRSEVTQRIQVTRLSRAPSCS